MPDVMDFIPLIAARKCEPKLRKAYDIAKRDFVERYALHLKTEIFSCYSDGLWTSMKHCASAIGESEKILERILNGGPPSKRRLPPLGIMETFANKLEALPAPLRELEQLKTDWKRQSLQPMLLDCLAENSPDLSMRFYPLREDRQLVHELDRLVSQIGTLDVACVGKKLTLGELLDLLQLDHSAPPGLVEIGACLWLVLRDFLPGLIDRLRQDADNALPREQSREFRQHLLELQIYASLFEEAHKRHRGRSKQLDLSADQHWGNAVLGDVSARLQGTAESPSPAAILKRLDAHDLDPPELARLTPVQLLQRSRLTSPVARQLLSRTPTLCPL